MVAKNSVSSRKDISGARRLTYVGADERAIDARFARFYLIRSQLNFRR